MKVQWAQLLSYSIRAHRLAKSYHTHIAPVLAHCHICITASCHVVPRLSDGSLTRHHLSHPLQIDEAESNILAELDTMETRQLAVARQGLARVEAVHASASRDLVLAHDAHARVTAARVRVRGLLTDAAGQLEQLRGARGAIAGMTTSLDGSAAAQTIVLTRLQTLATAMRVFFGYLDPCWVAAAIARSSSPVPSVEVPVAAVKPSKPAEASEPVKPSKAPVSPNRRAK